MKKLILMALACAASLAGTADQSLYRIATIAGSDEIGDDGAAATAQLSEAYGIAVDRSGNVYVSDTDHHRIRKITAAGIIVTAAGDGHAGFGGDGGPAQLAQLNSPYGIAVDISGNLYIADLNNHRIRKVGTDGVITTVAGTGRKGSDGDGGLATAAQLMSPRNVAVDGDGSLYISEFEGHRIRKVTSDGIIRTVAGTGVAGLNGSVKAIDAQLAYPAGLAVDRNGIVYIADSNNNMIRELVGESLLTLVDGRSGTLFGPVGVTLDAGGNLYVVDRTARVQRLEDGVLKKVAGSGQSGYDGDGGPATLAKLTSPHDIAFDAQGNLYIADRQHIRKVNRADVISTLAGDGYAAAIGDGSPATAAILQRPAGLALDSDGNLYVADAGTNRVRQISPDGIIRSIAGDGKTGSGGDGGPATAAQLLVPGGVAMDPWGNMFVADTLNHRVRKVVTAGLIFTIAGTGESGLGPDDTPSLQMPLRSPQAIAMDPAGSLYIADTGNHRVLRFNPDGTLSSAAGNGSAGFAGDGGRASLAQLNAPESIALDASGNLYIADSGNHRIRMVDTEGVIRTVAGSGVPGFDGDEGAAVSARLSYPAGIAVDRDGNLYVADTGNHCIRRITTDGTIRTIAGSGVAGFSGDGGPALTAQLNHPTGLVVDGRGNVFVSDSFNNRVRMLEPQPDDAGTSEPLGEAAVVNAASLRPGPVAPGEIVTIFSSGIGPDAGAGAMFDSNGLLQTSLAGTEALFDGTPAPLLYVGSDQVNAQAPYSIAGKSSTVLEVRYKGKLIVRMTLPVAASAPALFTNNGGTGLAVILNEDGTLNSESQPAPRGSVITLFATGEGQTDPRGVAGRASQEPFPRPQLRTSVTIGTIPAEILFAGEAPGFVGMLQINARVPAGFLPPGVVPISLTVGSAVSQPGVMIAVH